MAKDLGITTTIDLVPAMALGAEEVHPIEMAGAYATIASEGKQRIPYLVEEVLDRDGKVVIKADHGGKQVIPVEVARTVSGAMKRVVTGGTGTAARLPSRDVAGKTGTTNNYEDAWFVGYTPQVATAVWMGAPEGKVPMRNVGGIRVFGGSYPARIWKAYMEKALEGKPSVDFEAADEKAWAKAECLAVTVEKSLLRDTKRKTSTRGLAPSGTADAAGRGFGVSIADQVPIEQVVSGPTVPKATSRTATRGRTCSYYLGGSTRKATTTKKRVRTRTTTEATFVPVQVANPAGGPSDNGDLPSRVEQTTPPPVVAVTPAAEPAATAPPATSPPATAAPATSPPPVTSPPEAASAG